MSGIKYPCPCIEAERPTCAAGDDCWHFGNNGGRCAACNNTGVVSRNTAKQARKANP